MEGFRHPEARIAIEGGTSLMTYHRLIFRFSEDLDIRLIPSERIRNLPGPKKIQALKAIGQAFREHMARELPFLRPTKEGRVRRDAVVQSFIYDYDGKHSDLDVMHGIKCELVHIPLSRPVREYPGVRGEPFPAIDPIETAVGKWFGLAGGLPDRGDSYPDLVRHVMDLSQLYPLLVAQKEILRELVFGGEATPERIEATLEELRRPVWEEHHTSYAERMGIRRVGIPPFGDPPWSHHRERLERLAEEAELLPKPEDLDPETL